jgi:hypothetical protein
MLNFATLSKSSWGPNHRNCLPVADHGSSKLTYLGVEILAFVDNVVVVPEGKVKLPCRGLRSTEGAVC